MTRCWSLVLYCIEWPVCLSVYLSACVCLLQARCSYRAPARFCAEVRCLLCSCRCRLSVECSRQSQRAGRQLATLPRQRRARGLCLSRATLTAHKSHMLSDDCAPPQRATALKSLAQGGQPAAPAVWCTATPSQPSTSRREHRPASMDPASSTAAPSSMTPACAFISDPSPLQDPGGARTGRGLYGRLYWTVWAALLSHWWLFHPWRLVSSGLAWPVHRLVSPRALRPMSCRANPSWTCHHHKARSFLQRGGEQPPHPGPPAGSTCGPVRYWIWHMDGRLCVPQQKRPGLLQLCSCLWISRPRSTHTAHNTSTVLLTLIIVYRDPVFDTRHPVVDPP